MAATAKPVILVLVRHYVPAYKSGGPVRSIENTINALGHEIEFRVVCMDRDAMDTAPFPSVTVDRWSTVGKAGVFYASPQTMRPTKLASLITATPHDLLYVNSLFDPLFSIWPMACRKWGGDGRKNVLLAPRGELSAGALLLKRWKKHLFIRMAKMFGLYDGVKWHSTNVYETEDIRREFGQACEIGHAGDYGPHMNPAAVAIDPPDYVPDRLRLLFLSRIAPDKNLLFALAVLKDVKAEVEFNIAGPVEDPAYFRLCQDAIRALPSNVRVSFLGPIVRNAVLSTFAKHDLSILPTVGENFGHVVAESMSVGTPVLVSNRCGWRNLQSSGGGWDVPLETPNEFVRVIESCAAMPYDTRREIRRRAHTYYQTIDFSNSAFDENRRLFWSAVEASRARRQSHQGSNT